MKAEAWLVIEFTKPRYDYQKPQPRITKLYQRRPTEGLAVKIVLEMEDAKWEPTVHLKLHPLEVEGSVDINEFQERARSQAEKFLSENQ